MPEASAPAPVASASPSAPVIPAPDATAPDWQIWAAVSAALLLAAALFGWSRGKRKRPRPRSIPEAKLVPPIQPVPEAPHQPDATPVTQPATPANVLPEMASTGDAITFRLEATRLSATLVNATLDYRLIVVNRSDAPLDDVAIGGDMASAHASRPVDEQLGLAGPDLPPLHRIARIEPGEEVTLTGEMRLPLSAVLPIRHGEAQLLVPLARFDAWASAPQGKAVHVRAAFLVGQDGGEAARLQPFRLDLGPRVYTRLGQRALALPDA